MRVILDTTAFYPWKSKRSGALARILRASSSDEMTVYVPEVVIFETTRHFDREHLRPAHKQLRGALHALREAGATPSELENFTPRRDADLHAFEQRLRDELEEHRVITLELPDVGHDAVLARVKEARKPCKWDDDSYRDVLIWESILQLLADTGDSAVLVTANHKDFGKSPESDEIHDDLADDLEAAGCARDAVRRVGTPRDLVAQYLAVKDAVTERIAAIIEEREPGRDELEEVLRHSVPGQEVSGEIHFDLESDVESMVIASVLSIEKIALETVYEVERNTHYGVALELEASVDLEFFVSAPTGWDLATAAADDVYGDRSGGGFILTTEMKELSIPVELVWDAVASEWAEEEITLGEVRELADAPIPYYEGPLPDED